MLKLAKITIYVIKNEFVEACRNVKFVYNSKSYWNLVAYKIKTVGYSGRYWTTLTCAISNPRPSPNRIFFAGTLTFSNDISACPWGASSKPKTGRGLFTRTPGVRISTKIIDCCLCLAVVKSVFPWTPKKSQFVPVYYSDHTFLIAKTIIWTFLLLCCTRTHHDYEKSAPWIHGPTGPPLCPINDIHISFSAHGANNQSRQIGMCHI